MFTSNSSIWTHFLRQYYTSNILSLATDYPDRRSLSIVFLDLEKFNPELAEALLETPLIVLDDAGTALVSFDLPIAKTLDGAHIRITSLPDTTPIRRIRNVHIGKLIAVDGLVKMATEVRPDIVTAAFECTSCEEIMWIRQFPDRFVEPYTCSNGSCGRKGPFKLDDRQSVFEDVQKIKLQEFPNDMEGGEQPQTLDVTLRDDLAGNASPGDHVVIVGVLRSSQRVARYGKSTTFDIILDAVSIEQIDAKFVDVEISEEDQGTILELSRDPDICQRIARSVAPSIEGHAAVKEAITLQLVGGTEKELIDGTRVRGDIHILLIGDPGIAKSQLLQYVTILAPKSIYTAGRSSSASGLTAAVVKDDFGRGGWTLEAGALVLADQGICCVDEMDKMHSGDRSAIHEAMAQQTISIAKAGIMATLNSRCALLGAANPKYGRFSEDEGIAQQINMSSTLLSRFDLIYVLRDVPDTERDAAICRRILHRAGESKDTAPTISPDLLRKYLAYSKQNSRPVLVSQAVENRITQYYVKCRARGSDHYAPIPVTARWAEAVVRLAEASARLRLSSEISMDDADRAIRVMDVCRAQVGMDHETGMFDVDLIEVGISKSQRDRIKRLRDIIGRLSADHGGTAPLELVAADAVAQGIDSNDLDRLISDLLQQGDILAVGQGLRLNL